MRLIAAIPFVMALVGLGLTLFSANFGSPPTWSLVGPRAEAEVISSRVLSGPRGNGTTRYWPEVEVRLGDGRTAGLEGLEGSFFDSSQRASAAIVTRYVPGARVKVRPIGDVIFADRTDWFGLMHLTLVGLVTAFALVLCAIVLRALVSPKRR